MFSKLDFAEDKFYKGIIPFFLLNNKDKKKIYISSSEKNLDNYYFASKMFSKKKILIIDSETYDDNNYKLLKGLKSRGEFILYISLEEVLKKYSVEIISLKLELNKEYKLNEIIEFLIKNSYKKNYLVEKIGEFSLRGDILDIYLSNEENPIRIEFFDNNVESIRYFDVENQSSISKLDKFEIISNTNENKNYTLIELLTKLKVEASIFIENNELLNYNLEEYILLNRDFEEEIRENFSKIKEKSQEIELKRFTNEENDKFQNLDYIRELSKKKEVIIFSKEKRRYQEIFNKEKIKIENKPYFEGFENGKLLILTDRELKGVKVSNIKKRRNALKIQNINQIRRDDYIIHENYGVGKFLGIESIDEKDYAKINYADEDALYVPIDHINRIEKYISKSGEEPQVYKLGTRGFKRKKEKLKQDIIVFAKELIAIQARRKAETGFAFSQDTIWQEEFEEAFPYKETEDQLKAINDVKRDMEEHKIMDRIVCGDVGYGKTEVALRATFKAVMDGKQVAVMAPTTVLVNQHFQRFKERFKNYPIEIEMISRLEGVKKQALIIEKLKKGTIDIVIGTHRLISKDIAFKDIALLIIDEEQKFGVRAKEKIKQMKENLDLLTLTATPIPRTLNLALLGIRDISIIESPPKNRLPIKDVFIEKDEIKLRDVILKELARDGQVFYVFNKVKTIKYKLSELEKLLPSYVRVTYVHGQMPAKEIKEKIKKFEDEEYDVLITTTIIENGIDIENANTIVIENYDNLGMAQIYQLRGRVGRGNKQAYCYFLGKKEKLMTKKAKEKKLSLENLENVGAGFQLSLDDMKIRGAGEILGEKQHGAIESFGYDLYLKMLNEEVKRQKGISLKEENTKLDIKLKGFIPSSYIEEVEKIIVYKRLLLVENMKDLNGLKEELKDRFGRIPRQVKNLFEFYEIKILAEIVGIDEIKETKEGYYLKILENKIEIDKINMLILDGKLRYLQKEKKLLLREDLKDFLNKYIEGESVH